MRAPDTSLLGMVAASVVCAAGVLAAGLLMPQPNAPPVWGDQTGGSMWTLPPGCLEAPISPAFGTSGQAILCIHRPDHVTTLRLSGLTPDARYVVWAGSGHARAQCEDAPCPPTSLLGDSQGGSLVSLGVRVASPAGALELHSPLRDIRLSSGAQVTLRLVQSGMKTGPHAQIDFIIP